MADQQTPTPPNPEPTQETKEVSSTSIHVTVRDRKKVIFDQDAKAVTTRNDTGVLDVLPQHANFISLINESVTVHTQDGQKVSFPINNGVMKVRNNTVHCYIDLLAAEAQQAEMPNNT